MRLTRLMSAAGVVSTVLSMAVVLAPDAGAKTQYDAVRDAYTYARDHGYRLGVAVYDTRTGELRTAGDPEGVFATESVVKVFIATRLLVSGRMTGSYARIAWKMITQSDDSSASYLYGRVGGDGLITWVKRHYHVPDLGYPPSRAGWWGNTHITPAGLVKLYAKLKADPKVAPWLLRAMHAAREYGSDGTWQFFGLPQATDHPAIKQGWGDDFDDGANSADFNSTGYVDNNRYAVALLARGPISTYGSPIGSMLSAAARRLLPGGQFPDPRPEVTSLGRRRAALAGGRRLWVTGQWLTHVQRVLVGGVRASFESVSPRALTLTVPPHGAGTFSVRVITSHGSVRSAPPAQLTYTPPPAVSDLGPVHGPVAGGTQVVLHGANFFDVRDVRFGSTTVTKFNVAPRHRSVTVTAPKAAAAGDVPVVVHTPYGRSAPVTFTYDAPPTSGSGSG